MVVELVLEASHPRIAGIVQTHRQHIDALDGRHGGMERRIEISDVTSRSAAVSSGGGKPASSADTQPNSASHQTRRADGRREGSDEVLGVEQVLHADEELGIAADFP